MILDQQLFRNYNELYTLILNCYKYNSILKAYEKMQKEKSDLYNRVPHISNCFVLLVQKDLALTLWKIYYDKDPNANTVPRFRNTINELLRDSGCNDKQIKQEKINKSTKNKLTTLRKKYLAHVDMKRNDNRIEIRELEELLNGICRDFNRVCDVIDNDQISNISQMNIDLQHMYYYTELFVLYEHLDS